MNWTHEQAVALARKVEAICPSFGCHVALTGGTLYKDGLRKDCDLLFYRIRQVEIIDGEGLWDALGSIGLFKKKGFGWCFKAYYEGKPVDCFFPEAYDGADKNGDYPEKVEEETVVIFRDEMDARST